MINFDKSAVFYSSNTRQENRDSVTEVLGVQVVDQHEKYLGLPTMVGRSKNNSFNSIKDKVWKRLQGWKEKLLSKAGKEVLIKAVAQAIPTYALSMFKLLSGLCDELTRMMNKIWWGQSKDGNSIHWFRWNRMCMAKRDGGLGFRELESFNLDLLAKRGWRILHEPFNLCHRILKEKYFPNCDFLSAKIGNNPSLTWRSVLAGRETLKKGIRWRIGNGTSVRIWGDPWLPRLNTFRVISPCLEENRQLPVSELITEGEHSWDEQKLRELLAQQDLEEIVAIPLGAHTVEDKLIWHYDVKGLFSIKSAYYLENISNRRHDRALPGGDASTSSSSKDSPWSIIWSACIPNKVKIFASRLFNNILPTKDNLIRRGLEMEVNCCLCGENMESIFHLLFECQKSIEVWEEIGLNDPIANVRENNIK